MNVQTVKVNTQPQTNLEKTAKVAGKTALISAGLAATSSAISIKQILKEGDFAIGVYQDMKGGLLNGELVAEMKEFVEEAPKTIKKLVEHASNTIEKNKDKLVENFDDLIKIIKDGKVSKEYVLKQAKNIGKSALKNGAIVGGIYLVGKTIVDHVKAKKAE